MSEYSYPAGRVARPDELEDIGAYPPNLSLREDEGSALHGLARRRKSVEEVPASTPVSEPLVSPSAPEAGAGLSKVEPEKSLHKASTAVLPTALIESVAKQRGLTGWSAGTVLVEAIEATYNKLPALLKADQPTMAAGFSTRQFVAGAPAAEPKEPTSVFAFRLSGYDYDNMDRLVAELGARNRTHLMKTALSAYFKDMT